MIPEKQYIQDLPVMKVKKNLKSGLPNQSWPEMKMSHKAAIHPA